MKNKELTECPKCGQSLKLSKFVKNYRRCEPCNKTFPDSAVVGEHKGCGGNALIENTSHSIRGVYYPQYTFMCYLCGFSKTAKTYQYEAGLSPDERRTTYATHHGSNDLKRYMAEGGEK